MSNAPHQGSPGAPHLSYSTPATGPAPRRTSYASVAAGAVLFSPSESPTPAISSIRSYSSAGGGPVPSVHLPRIGSTGGDPSGHPPGPISELDAQADGGVDAATRSGGRGSGSMASYTSRRQSSQSSGHLGGLGAGVVGDERRGGGGSGGGSAVTGGFFRPSYLKGSTYLEKLEAEYQSKVAEQSEESQGRSGNSGALSSSPSSVSRQKMAPSHRGMTYEIVENQIPTMEEGPAPLPSKWTQIPKGGGLEIGPDGADVKYVGQAKLSDHEAAAARTDHPMPPECGIYYYEVTVLQKGKDGLIGVGFSGNKASLEKLPGWEPDSWAYHGDDGMSFCCQSTGKPYGPQFSTTDVIGCGVNFLTNQAFFTKNGVFLNYAFKDIRDTRLYPSIGMKRPNAHLEANFGQRPFVFDIDGMVQQKRFEITANIRNVDVSILHPTLSRDELCKALVAQYLSHDGYNETAKAFTREVRSQEATLHRPPRNRPSPLDAYLTVEEDLDAAHRQRIRTAILEGLIDEAIGLMDRHYPSVLPDNPQMFFQLKCRKFVEMMRLRTEYIDAANGSPVSQKLSKTSSVNGHHATAHSDDEFEPDMDLDESPVIVSGAKDRESGFDRMETEDMISPADRMRIAGQKHQDLLNDIISYGQELWELKEQFKDQSKRVTETMKEIVGMIAYPDPRKCDQAHLLDKGERIPLAEAVNSAILVSIGRSPSTALERLYKQAAALTDLLGEHGGVGSFVNVRNLLRDVGRPEDPFGR